MFRRVPRGSGLVVFAVCNLLFWSAVAVAVGMVASDTVDLGIESLARRYQATVVSSIVQSSRSPAATAPGLTAVRAGRPAVVAQGALPTVTQSTLPTAAPNAIRPTGSTLPQAVFEQPTQPVAPPNTTPQPEQATPPQPTEPVSRSSDAMISRPLLLADPEFNNLQNLDSELSRSAVGRPVQIRYQEAALNREVEDLLRGNPELPYRNVHIDLKRDRVIVTAYVTVLGFGIKTEVQGAVVARDCLPLTEVESVTVAGVFTPDFVRDAIKSMVQDVMSWYPSDYPLCLDQIVLEEDRFTLYGQRR